MIAIGATGFPLRFAASSKTVIDMGGKFDVKNGVSSAHGTLPRARQSSLTLIRERERKRDISFFK